MLSSLRRWWPVLKPPLRRWWPELITGLFLAAVAMAGQPGDPLFAFFCALIGAIFWAMGFRHRRLPLHDKLDKVGRDVSEVRDILLADDARDEGDAGDVGEQGLRLVR